MNKKYAVPDIGQKFGEWVVIDNTLKKNPKTKSSNLCVTVRCKCGSTKMHTLPTLYTKKTSSCIQCCDKAKIKFYGELSHTYFKSIKHNAEVRNLTFDVSIEYLWNLFASQGKRCALSGVELVLNPYMNWKQNKVAQTASVDRIDSAIGYTEGNLQWVHKHVNQMKMNLNQEEFLILCSLITNQDTSITKTKVISRFSVEGIHRWKQCPIDEVSYLRNYHRHTFNIVCFSYVSHNDRDVEFIELSHIIKQYLADKYYNKHYGCCFFDDMSCEHIAEEIGNRFKLYEVEVNEDGEGGAIVRQY